MLYKVYQLRHYGRRLTPEEVQATERTVCVVYGPHPMHPNKRVSLINPDTGGLMDYMDRADLKRLTDGAMMFGGSESHPDRTDTYQAWWCVPAVPAWPARDDVPF